MQETFIDIEIPITAPPGNWLQISIDDGTINDFLNQPVNNNKMSTKIFFSL